MMYWGIPDWSCKCTNRIGSSPFLAACSEEGKVTLKVRRKLMNIMLTTVQNAYAIINNKFFRFKRLDFLSRLAAFQCSFLQNIFCVLSWLLRFHALVTSVQSLATPYWQKDQHLVLLVIHVSGQEAFAWYRYSQLLTNIQKRGLVRIPLSRKVSFQWR